MKWIQLSMRRITDSFWLRMAQAERELQDKETLQETWLRGQLLIVPLLLLGLVKLMLWGFSCFS